MSVFRFGRRRKRGRVPRPIPRLPFRVGALAIGMALLAACGGATGGGAPDPNGTPRQGGSATVLLPGDSRGLDPYTANSNNLADGSRLTALYDVLLWSDPSTGTIRPQMAESMLADPETRVWTLTLRDGIAFTDGAWLDAAAVKRAWEKHLDPKLQSRAFAVVKPLKLTVVDRLRLKIELPSPNANFDRTVAHSLNFIPSPRTLESEQAFAASAKAPVGAGPFALREWVPNSHMTFDRNPTYWQKEKPHLDSVTFRIDPNTENAVKIIDSGDADLTLNTNPLSLADARRRGLGTGEIQLNGGTMFIFNTRTDPKVPLADPDLRRAIVYSLSTAEMNKRFFDGKGTPASGLFHSASSLANPQLSMPENEPATAAALFAKVTDNGRNPVTLRFLIPDSVSSTAMGQYVKEQVESVSKGAVSVELQPEVIAEYIKRTYGRPDFDIATFQVSAPDPEPAIYDFLHSASGPSNVTGYRNPAVDAALQNARLAVDRTLRTEAYTRVQMQLISDVPFFVFQENIVSSVANRRLTGVQLINDGLFLFDRLGVRR